MQSELIEALTSEVVLAMKAEVAPLLATISGLSARLTVLEGRAALVPRDGRDGLSGQTGERGPAGEQGLTGEPGQNGVDGKDGLNGKDGVDGKDGANGTDGTNGQDGAVGPVGPQGEIGPVGPTGEAGVPGANGQDGTNGSDGSTGPQGERGDKGLDGLAGKDGRDGVTLDINDLVSLTSDDDGRTLAFTFKRGDVEVIQQVKTALILDRGVYTAGKTYEPGDGVTWGGSFWIAKAETSERPGTDAGASSWRLAVKAGRDGKEGKSGPEGKIGPRGERGTDGRNGYS